MRTLTGVTPAADGVNYILVAARGLTGEQGQRGIQGPIGLTGDPGPTGNTGEKGDQGPPGPQGNGLVILDMYATLAALQAAKPTGSVGDVYAVGTASNNVIYIWSASTNSWVSIGAVQGTPGATGDQGPPGPQGTPGQAGIGLSAAGPVGGVPVKTSETEAAYETRKLTPGDAGAAPIDHRSASPTYGMADSGHYGHTKPGAATPSAPAVSGSAGTDNGLYARADHVHPLSNLWVFEAIPANSDLNTYRTPGLWRCVVADDARTIANMPPGGLALFTLAVYQHYGVCQELTTYFPGGAVSKWYRNYYSPIWSSWYRFMADNYLDVSNATAGLLSVARGGTGAGTLTGLIKGNGTSAFTAASDVNDYVPPTRTVNSKALSADITLSPADIGAVPTSRTINNQVLTGNISLTAANVSAVPTSRTVNGLALSANITLNAGHVNALPIAGGTLSGPLVTENPDISVSAVRNSVASMTDLEAGTSPLPTGALYFVYE